MRSTLNAGRLLAVAATAFALSACSGNLGPSSPSSSLPAANTSEANRLLNFLSASEPDHKIQHVVILIQENRSFDNLFEGYPGADTQSYGYDSSGDKITLQPIPLEAPFDLEHDSTGFFEACNGTGSYPGTDCRMNGFNLEACDHNPSRPCPTDPEYGYVPHSETQPYFKIAKEFVLADKMFASNFDASSFISHQYIIAAQAMSAVNVPDGLWGCEGGPDDTIAEVSKQRKIPNGYEQACFNDDSLGEEFDNAGISWRFYTNVIYIPSHGTSGAGGLWSAYQANHYVYYGPDWKRNVVTPQTQFFTDVSNGKLPAVSWVTPTWANSDHPGTGSNTGPSWVASVVNAIGESKYWKSTAIFIFWDDYGGWYDHVPPRKVDYDGLGMRLPMLIVSPYAKKGYVSHVRYEHGSILKFIEDRWGLRRLAASDTRANSPEEDCFDFSQKPRSFSPIPTVYGKEYFLHQKPDYHPPDTN
jgi:phospholipase C